MILWTSLILVLMAVAGFFLVNAALGWGVDVALLAWRRWQLRGVRGMLARYLQPQTASTETDATVARQELGGWLRLLLPITAGILAALLGHDWLLSPYLVLLGVVVGVIMQRQHQVNRKAENTADVEQLVAIFRSVFAAQESLAGALEEVWPEIPAGRLQAAVRQMLSTLRVRQNVEEAVRPLVALHNPYVNQFVFIVTRLDTTDRKTSLAALAELEERLRASKRLRERAHTALVVLRLTVRTLQGGLLATMLAVLTFPLWRSFFMGTLAHRIIFLVMTVLAVAASLFFDNETSVLQEQVL